MFTRLWSDPEIGARIYLQAQMLFAGEVAGPQKDRLYGDILYDVMHKLSAMLYHLESYRATEQRLYEEHRSAFQIDPNSNQECFPLIFTFEGFLFQLKSCLDMMAKSLTVVELKNAVSTKTYGDKGDGIIKGLRSNREVIRRLLARGKDGAGEHLFCVSKRSSVSWRRRATHGCEKPSTFETG